MKYLQQLLKSNTVKVAIGAMIPVAIAYLNGAIDGRAALVGVLMALQQIYMRTVTTDSIKDK